MADPSAVARHVPGTLYLVPNLLGIVAPEAVLPQRTLDVARALRRFVVENAKPTRAFLKGLALDVPLASLAIDEIPRESDRTALEALLAPAMAGEDIGVVSDAGCPGIADPGGALVATAHRLGIRVVPLVGPSAILLALMAAGCNGQSFAFHGYLPVDAAARIARIAELEAAIARTGATQLFIETPYRNEAMLGTLLAHCRAETQLCVAADLTLPNETIVSAPVRAWKARPVGGWAKRPALFLLGRAAG